MYLDHWFQAQTLNQLCIRKTIQLMKQKITKIIPTKNNVESGETIRILLSNPGGNDLTINWPKSSSDTKRRDNKLSQKYLPIMSKVTFKWLYSSKVRLRYFSKRILIYRTKNCKIANKSCWFIKAQMKIKWWLMRKAKILKPRRKGRVLLNS